MSHASMTFHPLAPVASAAGTVRSDPMIDHIKLSSYDGNSEWRIARLNQYIGVLYAKEPAIVDKIKALHDHKGVVNILWASEPFVYERSLTDHVWEAWEGTPAEHRTDAENYP